MNLTELHEGDIVRVKHADMRGDGTVVAKIHQITPRGTLFVQNQWRTAQKLYGPPREIFVSDVLKIEVRV